MIKHKNVKFGVLAGLIFGLGFLVGSFLVTSLTIKNSIKERCFIAINQYEGDCVEALIQVVDGDINSYSDRNRAIWALGQIGDDREGRVREVIEKYYIGEIPEREPYDEDLSQYEMKKALNLLSGGWNITHLVWSSEKVINY